MTYQIIDLTKEGAEPYCHIAAPATQILDLVAYSRAGWYLSPDVREILETEEDDAPVDARERYFRVDLFR